MPKYLFVYHGGDDPQTEEEAAKVYDDWGQWMASLGAAVIDGGNPVGQSKTVNPDGSVVDNGGPNPASGYGIFDAKDDADALDKAKGCPILKSNGSVELAPIIDM